MLFIITQYLLYPFSSSTGQFLVWQQMSYFLLLPLVLVFSLHCLVSLLSLSFSTLLYHFKHFKCSSYMQYLAGFCFFFFFNPVLRSLSLMEGSSLSLFSVRADIRDFFLPHSFTFGIDISYGGLFSPALLLWSGYCLSPSPPLLISGPQMVTFPSLLPELETFSLLF